MPTSAELMRKHKQIISEMDRERQPWFNHWRTISDYFLPRRYPFLLTSRERQTKNWRNSKLLNSTSTIAVRTLASGMMNGITSPARPWFSLRIAGLPETEVSGTVALWLDTVTRTMMMLMAESNFYNALAILYLEWCTFGTALMTIYEDVDEGIRCYNHPLGSFFLSQDNTQRVNRIGRQFTFTVEQLEAEFGYENLATNTQMAFKKGGAALLQSVPCSHIIEKNYDDDLHISGAKWREVYWESSAAGGKYLAVRPFYSWPAVAARWELFSDDSYGNSPAMDALGDVIELQKTVYDQAQGRGKTVRPPLIVDQLLRNRPTALHEGGITYASALNTNFGAKEAYKTNFPFQETRDHIQALEQRIRETCHNNLFNMISQLDTVRSATEIDARREEKLVHLGPVLERFENEGLDPALSRIFEIGKRNGLFPPVPEELSTLPTEIQYVSVLSDAQRAVGTVPIERFLALSGQLAGVFPEAQRVPNVDELMRQYADGIGIKTSGLHSREDVAEAIAADAEQQQLAQTAAIGKDLAQGAAAAGQVDMGGGQNAVSALLGG